jgi:hypothetical protein
LGFAFVLLAACLTSATAAASYSEGTIWTLVGTGALADSGDGGHSREAAINQPRAVSAIPAGGYAWAEPYANRVRMVDGNGVVSTLAGTGVAGSSGDGGQARLARLNFVHTAAPTADGGFLLAETKGSRIRKVSRAGIISTVAGTGAATFSGDGGPATSAAINNPRSVSPLADGGFLIPDTNNNRVRHVSAAGVIRTVAGTGTAGFSGDGGAATEAQLDHPFAVAPTSDGGFLIADIENERIRKVSAAGVITTVAGNGVSGFGGDGGPATSASLHDPHNVVGLADGGFLISDTSNERVRHVDPGGVIRTVVGDGVRGSSGDGGPAASARLAAPKAVSVTPEGDLLIADEQSNRIRFVGRIVRPTNLAPPTISGEPFEGRRLTASTGVWHGTGPVLSYQWQRCSAGCASVPGATANSYTPGPADAGATLRISVTASNPAGELTVASLRTTAIPASGAPRPTPAAPSPTTPPRGSTPGITPPGATNWVVRVTLAVQRAQEYLVRGGNSRLSDAIKAFGAPSCRIVTRTRLTATWVARGVRVDARAKRALPRRTSGCSAPASLHVSEIRLTDQRWTTSLGLRVGDPVARLLARYPKAAYVRGRPGSSSGEYYLVWQRKRCVAGCTAEERRRGIKVPRLTAQVANGRVTVFRLPVSPTG